MIFMKKHLVLIINIILVLVIVAGVGLVVYNAMNSSDAPDNTQQTPTFETISKTDSTQAPTQAVETFNIGILQHSDIDNCNSVYDGICKELGNYFQDACFMIDYVLEVDNDKCKEEIQRFIDSDIDLIVAIGPFAANLASSMTTEIPIVFAAVQEPEEEGLVETNEVPGGNVTGVSDYTPCFEQIYSVKEMFPDCKKIGAIYNATNKSAVEQALMGKKEAEREEVSIPYEEYKVGNEKDITEALDSMIDDGVEVIYVPVDKYLAGKINLIVDFSLEHKIPVVCGNKTMLDKGCFSTCVTNYEAIGRKAAEIIVNILVNEADVSTLPVSYTNECYLHINADVMDKLGVQIPANVVSKAILD